MLNKIHMPVNRFFMALLLMLSGLGYVGCGIKGPPVPPATPPVPAVTGLSHQLDGSTAILNWGLAGHLSREQAGQSTWIIYRHRTDLSEPACENCPLVFEKVATVPFVDTDTDRFSTAVGLDAGYRYVFKVRLQVSGRPGADAEPVRFDFPPESDLTGTETQ